MRTVTTLALTTVIGLSLATPAMAASRTFELDSFASVDIATGLDAVVTQGESFAVTATSNSQQALDNLQVEVDGDALKARLDQNFLDFILSGGLVGMLLSSGNAVTLEITLPQLNGIDASSGADVRADGIVSDQLVLRSSSGADIALTNAELGTLRMESSSGADLEVSGTAQSVSADASSGADIEAEGLEATTVTASASSGADISVTATASVDATASSGGDVHVHGNPTSRNVDTSSGGDVNFDD
ncbi:MAG TPA: head GIN domain-containing protein [Devosia sp.]|jgi:hypothetical protein|nr:head GIN domain-containing protein [Devosia sp.]